MKVVFSRPDDEERTQLAEVIWADGIVDARSDDEDLRARLVHAFRRTPVVIDDPALRRMGTHGEVVLQPGDIVYLPTSGLADFGYFMEKLNPYSWFFLGSTVRSSIVR